MGSAAAAQLFALTQNLDASTLVLIHTPPMAPTAALLLGDLSEDLTWSAREVELVGDVLTGSGFRIVHSHVWVRLHRSFIS